MDINHPLYSTLKDYYTNLDINSSDIDNSLLLQYIEDTCGIDKNDDNFRYFNECYLQCDKMYFVNMIKTSKTLESYCYFTNKFLNRFCIVEESCSDVINCYGMISLGKYNFIYCKAKQNNYINLYLFINTTTLEKN
jgi:hypothetical protein